MGGETVLVNTRGTAALATDHNLDKHLLGYSIAGHHAVRTSMRQAAKMLGVGAGQGESLGRLMGFGECMLLVLR
jgi:hypothetical protein